MGLLLLLTVFGVVASQQDSDEIKFRYGKTKDGVPGPRDWKKYWDECGRDRQSPIDIRTSKVRGKSFSDLKMTFDNPRGLVTGTLENTGHYPKLQIEGGGAELTGGPLSETYKLKQFHLHFGCKNNRGSEHKLDGKRFSGQLHLVFKNPSEEKNAVVAIWLKAPAKGNKILGNFANLQKHIIHFKSTYKVKESDGIYLMDLIPRNCDNEKDYNCNGKNGNGNNGNGNNGNSNGNDGSGNDGSGNNGSGNNGNGNNDNDGNGDGNGNNGNNGNYKNKNHDHIILECYYTYEGSLTTPPCLETVTWIVLKPKLLASNAQMKKFRKLRSPYGKHPPHICDNYRPIQKLNGRKIYFVSDDH